MVVGANPLLQEASPAQLSTAGAPQQPPASPPPIFCPKVLPLPPGLGPGPQKSQSSFDLLSLNNSNNNNASASFACPVLPPPPLTLARPPPAAVTSASNTVPQFSLSEALNMPAPQARVNPPHNLNLAATSMLNLSLNSPTKAQPRTNPYYQPPKSPKTEFGPFSGPAPAGPPPLPATNPMRPFKSSLNLASTQDTVDRPKTLPPKPRSPPPRPPPILKSASHASLPSLVTSSHHNPFSSSNKPRQCFNPFLSSTSAPVPLPPAARVSSNPFRAPLSSFPPEDPSDTSRLLGIQLFTELLAASLVPPGVESVVTNRVEPPSCSSVSHPTNNVSDPLTQPPPTSATLPPLPRKPSTGPSDPPPAAAPPSALVTKAAGDKYSALAELDDLFRSTALDSPAAPAPAPEPGPVFSPAPAPGIPNMFVSEPERGAASPSWFGRSSPAAGGGWGGAGGKTSPMWTPVWDSSAKPAPAPGLAPAQQNTNPFGSSPSNPPLGFGQMFSDNNNDLFAAAPKPFITEKPGEETEKISDPRILHRI